MNKNKNTETMELSENEISSDSSDDENQTQELEKQAKELELQISNNKYLYDVHIQLIDLYEKIVDFNSLRTAFQRFHECFPLTPKLWLKWIKIEMQIATSDQEKNNILELFDKAVEDYLSVNLWQEYAQYAMDISSIEDTREILERALNSAGLHVSDGSLLWDFLREIELATFSVAEKDSEAWKEQAARVIEVFRRQLSVPLIDMEDTYNEWKEWKTTLPENFKIDTQPTEWGYKKALTLLKTYKPFEDELMSAVDDNQTLEIYKKYIEIVKDPSTIICLYERAVSQLCLNPSLWLDYCNYMFKLGESALKTSERSLRNCPWSEELWVMKLRILENLNKDKPEVLSSFENALTNISPSPGLDLWLTYIEFIKRNSNDKEELNKLFIQAEEQVGEYDSNSSIERLHARILAKTGEIKEAISIWNGIVGKVQNKGNFTVWLEYINLVKQFGDLNQTRTVYQRAINSCKDWSYYIAEEWLLFERESGTLTTILKCVEKCKTIKVQHEQQTKQTQETEETIITKDKKGKKRKTDPEVKQDVKRVKKEVEKLSIEPKKPIEKDPAKTVFISNIGPSVEEKTLKSMFPNAVNIEVSRDRKGNSKCFAFVQFSMEEEVMTALARDREPLNGRPVFISNLKPDKNERKPVFKYSAEVEEKKLFVRGLPKTMTKDDVMKIFEPFGALEVRIVVHKTGQSKGLAYVEFPDVESTKKAMEKTDNMVVGEHTISVAVSAPPPKRAGDEREAEPVRHARSRLQIPMIPRALQVKSEKSENGQQSAGGSKSNDDFRKMLSK